MGPKSRTHFKHISSRVHTELHKSEQKLRRGGSRETHKNPERGEPEAEEHSRREASVNSDVVGSAFSWHCQEFKIRFKVTNF